MPKPLHLLSKRRKQQLINEEILLHQNLELFKENKSIIRRMNIQQLNIDSVDCENSSITNNKNFPSLHEFNCNVNLQDNECIENSFNESENTYHIEHNSNFDNNQEIGNYFDNLEYSNLNENVSSKEPEQNITLNNNTYMDSRI